MRGFDRALFPRLPVSGEARRGAVAWPVLGIRAASGSPSGRAHDRDGGLGVPHVARPGAVVACPLKNPLRYSIPLRMI